MLREGHHKHTDGHSWTPGEVGLTHIAGSYKQWRQRKEGHGGIPVGREEEESEKERGEFLSLFVGGNTKPEITHQFVVRVLFLNGFPKKSTKLFWPLPPWRDVAIKYL